VLTHGQAAVAMITGILFQVMQLEFRLLHEHVSRIKNPRKPAIMSDIGFLSPIFSNNQPQMRITN
jgi:hypothetical protein